MAKQIIEFVEKNKDSTFYLHCDAGMSRSVAVGMFICDFYGHELNLRAIKTTEHYNKDIYNLCGNVQRATSTMIAPV